MANLIVCDLDGTLMRRGVPISSETVAVMRALQEQGDIVAIATGRNLYSGYPVLPSDLPLDYWVFSTGVGIVNWATKDIEYSRHLEGAQIQEITEVLTAAEANFMMQKAVPDNHHFVYRRFANSANDGTDFDRRLAHYQKFSQEMADVSPWDQASQFIAVLPPELARLNAIRDQLTAFSVVRATSPFDGQSIWLEIFAPGVNKSAAAAWLAGRPELAIETTYALGNDYNDLDLLEWADHAMLAAASPPDLKEAFASTEHDTELALPEAVARWGLLS